MNEEGEHTEEGEDDPNGRYHYEGIMTVQAVSGIPTQQQEQEGTTKSDQHRKKESQRVVFLEIDRHPYAPSHQEGLDEQQ